MKQWSMSSQISKTSTPVYLNIYSFCHCCNLVCGWMGLGLYHTAIEILGIEYMFHGWAGTYTGVSEVEPRTCPYRFEKQVLLGNIDYTFYEFDRKIVEPLKEKFISNTYDLLNNNCNHFALVMAQKLNLHMSHPQSYIFRITDCCNVFRCCIPNCILSGRLDWFTDKGKQVEQLQEIRNSQIKYSGIEGNASRYQQLAEELEEVKPDPYHLHPRIDHLHPQIDQQKQALLPYKRPVVRPKIFNQTSNSP